MTPVFDLILRMPTLAIVLLVLALWGTVAVVVHRLVVPQICGPDGKRLGRFEAEVTSQIALAFGLLISFNAVWVWDRGDRVRDAVFEEAAALESALDEADFNAAVSADERRTLHALVAAYTRQLIDAEWPELSHSRALLERPPQLIELRRFAARFSETANDAVKRAESARETRIRDGQMTMPRSRWIIVFALAILTLVSIGALHGDSPRGRALALALVTLAIAFCFVVLFVSGRPFIGDYAIQPDALREVAARASAPAP
jgi:Protein of unknown function (DUF4239)